MIGDAHRHCIGVGQGKTSNRGRDGCLAAPMQACTAQMKQGFEMCEQHGAHLQRVLLGAVALEVLQDAGRAGLLRRCWGLGRALVGARAAVPAPIATLCAQRPAGQTTAPDQAIGKPGVSSRP